MSNLLLRQLLRPRFRTSHVLPSMNQERQLHRRPKKKFPPSNPMIVDDDLPGFNARKALKEREDELQSVKNDLQRIHGYVNSEEPKIQRDQDDHDFSYAKFLKSEGFPAIKRIHGWEKKSPDLKMLRKLFTNKTYLLPPAKKGDQETEEKGGKEDTVVLEGKRLINEALDVGLAPQKVITSRIELLKEFPSLLKVPRKSEVELYLLPYQLINLWSDTSTSPGFMFSFKKDDVIEKSLEPRSLPPLPVSLILDNVRNPDNLGGILRVGAAAGCKRIFTTKGCVSVWSSKVIRSAAGAHFHVPITTKFEFNEEGVRDMGDVFIADLKKADEVPEEPIQTMPYFDANFHAFQEITLVIGGETEGISSEARQIASENRGKRIYVPLFNKIDSLNVTSVASILLFHIQKEMMKNK